MTDDFARLVRLRDDLKAWALEHAFPVWWDVGADKVNGGFFEKIALDGTPVEAPRRARVQPRQIYSYAVAGLLGWDGPWKQALEHGLDFYLSKYRRPDGFMRTLVASDGSPLDDKVDLYDQAFGLFGLAMASSVLPERADLPALAVSLREALYATLKHPTAGFEESVPRTLPLLSNPHMHLFEASLAWVEAGGDAQWRALADEIAELALTSSSIPRAAACANIMTATGTRPGRRRPDRRAGPPVRMGLAAAALGQAGRPRRRDRRRPADDRHRRRARRRPSARRGDLRPAGRHERARRHRPPLGPDRADQGRRAGRPGDRRRALVDHGRQRRRGAAEVFRRAGEGPVARQAAGRRDLRRRAAPASSFYHIVCAILELDRAVSARS
jgi:hypothetical protein